jgi:hypothetical protein
MQASARLEIGFHGTKRRRNEKRIIERWSILISPSLLSVLVVPQVLGFP